MIDSQEGSQYAYQYSMVSGRSEAEYAFIGYRFLAERGFDYDYLDSWICIARDGLSQAARGIRGWLTAVWLSDAGAVYASDADSGSIHRIAHHRLAQSASPPWQVDRVGGALMGVWGLDETHVYTWGGIGRTCHVHRFDGTRWHALPAIEGSVLSLRGCAPDCLYAVGDKGLVQRFDGNAWRPVELHSPESFTGIWVASPDEVYVCGQAGHLYELSQDGFIERAHWNAPLQDVAKFKGNVWIGGNETGLLRLVGTSTELEVVKPNIDADQFDARQDLLMAAGNRIVATPDGASFTGIGKGVLRKLLDADPPMFGNPD